MEKGTISVETKNIFPIIKQFLYSDQEIFLRELISNAVDATSKLKTLSNKGIVKGDLGDLTIEVILDKEAKTLTIRDKGIGLTGEEAKKYLNQVAFSSAEEFVEKYQADDSIIGHFGLGFYSAFMVAETVDVVSLSHQDDAHAIQWSCAGDPSFSLDDSDKGDRGTDVILHISDDSAEYLEENRIQELLDKYCRFLPVEIKFGTKTIKETEGEGDDAKEVDVEVDNIVNNPSPIWKKSASSLTDEDYQNFYQELFPYSTPPLFWIHLNIDYPFNLTGILYFPKISNQLDVQKNKIHLYSNQVFVTDEVKDIVPEFLMLLHGVIDSPDIPLNVSRSYLQSDKNVKKITNYITKKVAEKLSDLYKKDKDGYIEKWNEIAPVAKYGLISEEKFYDKALSFTLLKNTKAEHFTIDEYKEKVKALQTDKHNKIIMLYTNDVDTHYSYIQTAENRGYDVLLLDHVIDNHFVQHLEYKLGDVTFVRVDSDTIDNIVQKEDQGQEDVLSEKELEKVKDIFKNTLKSNEQNLSFKALSPEDAPLTIVKPEFMRRMREMQQFQTFGNEGFPESISIVVNTNHPLVASKLVKMRSEEKKTDLVKYLFDLGRIEQGMLNGKDRADFVTRTLALMND